MLREVFDGIAAKLAGLMSFAAARKISREEFASAFLDTSDVNALVFAGELFQWSQDKLHSRANDDRLVGLSGFSFYIDMSDDQQQLEALAQSLDRILPVDVVYLVEGIAHLLKRIMRRLPVPLLPKLVQRAASLATRSTKGAVLSSVFLILRFVSFDSSLPEKFPTELNAVITTSLRFDDREIQRAAVELTLRRAKYDPSANEFVSTCLTSTIYVLQSDAKEGEIIGLLMLVSAFLSHYKDVCVDRAGDLFPVVTQFLAKNPSEEFLPVLALLCEMIPTEAARHSDAIRNVFRSGTLKLENIVICRIFERVIRALPADLSDIWNDKSLFSRAPDCFFILAKTCIDVNDSLVDRAFLLDAFSQASLSEEYIDACVAFAKKFPSDVFRVVKICTSKISCGHSISLLLLSKFSFLPQFPLLDYWQSTFECFNNGDEQQKLAALPALLEIMKREDEAIQREKLLSLLCAIQRGESSLVKVRLLSLIDESLIELLTHSSLFFVIEQLFEEDDHDVKKAALKLVSRLREFSELSVFNFFHIRLHTLSESFFQIALKSQRAELMRLVPKFIRSSGSFIRLHGGSLTTMLKRVLSPWRPTSDSMAAMVIERRDMVYERRIRILALKSFMALSKWKAINKDMLQDIIDRILDQMFSFRNTKLHLVAIKTLRSIFRSIPVLTTLPMEQIVEFHQSLLQFIRTSTNADVNTAMMRLLGTIGPLDPHEFHALKSQPARIAHDYPLCDRTRREQSYLNFVMRYILGQLRDGSKIHDTSVLITAIVYIFQSDPYKCLAHLGDVVSIFKSLLVKENPVVTTEELFHFFRSIVLVVDINILPHAKDIYEMILRYLQPRPHLLAVKLLAALIFALKAEFTPYGADTFKLASKILHDNDKSDFETNIFLLLTITLITIYAGGASHWMFQILNEWAEPGNEYTELALQFLCQAMRCCNFQDLVLPCMKLAFKLQALGDERIKEGAISLLQLLILRFPKYALSFPLWSMINVQKASPKLAELIEKMQESEYECVTNGYEFLQQYDAVPDPFPIRSKPVIQPSSLSKIFERARLESSVSENDWSSWLLQFSQELVLCSNSPAIRASHPLLRFTSDFEMNLFPFIVVSVWDIASEEDRQTLSNYLLSIVHNSQAPLEILTVIVSACEAMDRANFSLFPDPFVSGQTAERCKSWLAALRFFEKAVETRSSEALTYLMGIHSLMKRKESALGLLKMAKTDSNCTMLEALSMWSQARDIYAKRLEEDSRNETNIERYLFCSALLEDWPTIRARESEFASFSKDMQTKIAVLFAGAAASSHEDSSLYLNAIRRDDPRTCMWRTIISIDKNFMDTAIQSVKRGQALLTRDMSAFVSGTYEPAIYAICTAMIFEELNDVIKERNKVVTAENLLTIWSGKADYIKRDPDQLRHLYRVRGLLQCDEEQSLRIKLAFVDSLRRSKEWTLFDNVYNRLLKECSDERVNLLRAKVRYDRGMVNDLSEFEDIINRLKEGDVYCDAVCAYCSRTQSTSNALHLLDNVCRQQRNRVRAWKHWAYFNLRCIQDNDPDAFTYAGNAMMGFAHLIKINRPLLHYLCQLCSLFFRYGPRLSKFADAKADLLSLTPSSVIQIIPQLMVQFDHENEQVRDVVFKIVENFAVEHFQGISMPLCLIKRTPSASPRLLDFIDKMSKEHHELMHDADVFSTGMLDIAVTVVEEVIVLLEKVQHLVDSGAHDEAGCDLFMKMRELILQNNDGFLHEVFDHGPVRQFKRYLEELFAQQGASRIYCCLMNNVMRYKNFLQQQMEAVTTIDIAEQKPSILQAAPFSLAVPGFYSVDKTSPTILDIGHVMKLIPSAKRPRKIRMMGSDGRCYKYLLKGREDLRMDQRIMQLFSLTNSILHDNKFGVEKHLQIHQVPIVPLAPNAGLIAWAEGGETIYSMITWHRRVIGIDVGREQSMLKRYVGDENDKDMTLKLTNIQKVELHCELCKLAPDDAIRETMWLRSQNAELWLARSTNFARSNGLMSIIGYIMGIGDRHPSNILVMKGTGNVVHIDFSDCFEKASLRAYVRETVPFRLTRMLVRAFGPSGIQGVFSMTAEYVMGLMRRNRETLLAFLDIFVQDPITDTIWYRNAGDNYGDDQNKEVDAQGSMFKRAMVRVNDKLKGTEFGEGELNVQDQVTKLIETATSEIHLAQMYYGWSPFW